ncbi:MAG: hypothetical protein RIC55_04590 [Pirellulaceae bacterium]
MDFVDSSARQPESIVPGLGGNTIQRRGTLVQKAKHLLGCQNANDVIGSIQSQIAEHRCNRAASSSQRLVQLDQISGKSEFDLLFTDGVQRHSEFDLQTAMASIRSASMFGPCSTDDFRAAIKDPAFRHCTSRIAKAAKDRKPGEFKTWLRNIREHGYLKLLPGGYKLAGYDKDQASERAHRIFCALLWIAYQELARCYGALMFVAWTHFSIDLDLSPIEDALFRQINFPQLYLAGLPLAFLSVNHLRWILEPLLHNWRNDEFEPEAYDGLTKMLGMYAAITAERRKADRSAVRVESDRTKEIATDDQECSIDSADLESIPRLTSLACNTCGGELQAIQVVQKTREDGSFVAELRCEKCDVDRCFSIDPKLFISVADVAT